MPKVRKNTKIMIVSHETNQPHYMEIKNSDKTPLNARPVRACQTAVKCKKAIRPPKYNIWGSSSTEALGKSSANDF